MVGLRIDEDALVNGVIGNTTKRSLEMQMANFRFALNIEGYQLEDVSQAMWDVINKYKDYTSSMIRTVVREYIEGSADQIALAETKQNNKASEKRRLEVNEASQAEFDRKLKYQRKHRRLRSIGVRSEVNRKN